MSRVSWPYQAASWLNGKGRVLAGPICLGLILVVGAAFRIYGLSWDEGHWLHPDERQIFFVVEDLGWPSSVTEALSTDSPLNPHFFAYGSLPIYLLRLIASLLALFWPVAGDPDNLHIIGRPLAVLFDLGTVFLTYRLGRAVLLSPSRERPSAPDSERNRSFPATTRTDTQPAGKAKKGPPEKPTTSFPALTAAALVSLAVIHVQIAHFYTVDTFLTFFIVLTLNLGWGVAQSDGRWRLVALGTAFGLAIATKVTAALLSPAVFVALTAREFRAGPGKEENLRQSTPATDRSVRRVAALIGRFAFVLVVAGVVFVVLQPYAVIDWHAFVDRTMRESAIAWGKRDVPYTLQFAGTWPFLYSIWQLALWGVGLPVGLAVWAGFLAALVRWLRRGGWVDTFLLAWAAPYLVFAGLLHARYLRYMLPMVPILCILAVRLLMRIPRQRVRRVAQAALLIASLAYCLLFASIYATPHSWVQASEWIYRNVPAWSTLAVERWDRALPLPRQIDDETRSRAEYGVRTLTLYAEPDDAEKWDTLARDLSASDYVILASRRLYGSIPRLPDRYPVASRYYEELFAGDLGFELVGEFTRGPTWLNPRLPPLEGAVPEILRPDESFFVYDHPRALVFRNSGQLPASELLQRLQVR